MKRTAIRAYCSPTLVLLALDWADGDRDDFLGFAIERTPGMRPSLNQQQEPKSWLPNRVGFEGPPAGGQADFPSNTNSIQKFQWWDARIDDPDRGATFTYKVWPVVGDPDNPTLVDAAASLIQVRIPETTEHDIGTYFNRAVVSSQAFAKEFGSEELDEATLERALKWLANGLETVSPEFLEGARGVDGAIYHLTDRHWVVPAIQSFDAPLSNVYNSTSRDDGNADVVDELSGGRRTFAPRTRANIMHNKFLVRMKGRNTGTAVLTGSANFTTEGLSTQANVLHTFASPDLAKLFLERKELLDDDPTIAQTARDAGWSKRIRVGDAKVRVFFPPEPKGDRESLDVVVDAVRNAKSSVLFCLFSPTDADLREACFDAGDEGKMMFGLVNTIADEEPDDERTDAGSRAKVEIYHRSRDNRDVFAHDLFRRDSRPGGFWWETRTLPGRAGRFPVFIHHKFVVIDAETKSPTIFTGSANMSGNALYRNDENLLEITECPRLAATYLAEFMRLYEHYRARATWNRYMRGRVRTYTLSRNARWTGKAYKKGTPEWRARVAMTKG